MTDREIMTNEEALRRVRGYLTDLLPIENYDEVEEIMLALGQQPITWIVGKDNCQVAVRNMPIDKMQKICAIIGEEEQQPKTIQEKQAESEKYQKAFDDGYENGYAQARFDYGQQPCEDMRDATEEERKSTKDYIDSISKPTGLQFDDIYEELNFVQPHKKTFVNLQLCEDCVKRKDVKSGMIKYGFLAPDMTVTEFVEDMPPVTPTSDAFDKIINKIEQTRDKDKIAEYPYNRCIRIIEEYIAEREEE